MPIVASKINPKDIVVKNYGGPAPWTPSARPRDAEALPDISALSTVAGHQTNEPPLSKEEVTQLTIVSDSAPAPLPIGAKEPAPIQVESTPPAIASDAAKAPPPIVAAKQKNQAVAVKNIDGPNGQAEKFWTVTGTVEEFRKTWRVRYAAIDQEDRFGGVVVLDGGDELNQLRDGMNVRVRGTLVPPTDRTGSAHYRVRSLEILE